MSTVLAIAGVWVGLSVLVGIGFSLGAALGYRRGFEAGRELHDSEARAESIDLTDPRRREELVRAVARQVYEARAGD
jgi:hypothetical protein